MPEDKENSQIHDWTFVCELCGGTYTSQYAAENISTAIDAWKAHELANVLDMSAKWTPRKFEVDAFFVDEAVPLIGLQEAYCWTFTLDFKRFGIFATFKTGLVTIVRTAK